MAGLIAFFGSSYNSAKVNLLFQEKISSVVSSICILDFFFYLFTCFLMIIITMVIKVYSQVSSEKTRRTDDTEQKVENNRKNKLSRIKRFKNYISKVLFDSLAEYGPPYEFDEYYSGALLFQCSRPIEKSLEVHRLLNAKIDPNDVDPTELNYTPMHWCAKHCYLKSMRMLVMAKGHINVTNEFGQSPLSLCIMMMPPLNKKGALYVIFFLVMNIFF
jgi:ankyrin repeat protein